MIVQPDSFAFAGVDMLAQYGIRCVSHDPLLPKLRERTIALPGHDGAHDFGARRYDTRTIKLDCDSMRSLSREELREVAYLLTRKGRLVLWDEPDKYYVGQIYKETQLKYLGIAGHEFPLTFSCEPFAYGKVVSDTMPVQFAYAGTAETPTRIQITNTGTQPIIGLTIRIRERSDNY